MVPSAALPPESPLTAHWIGDDSAPFTLAKNWRVPPIGIFAVGGSIETEFRMSIWALPLTVGSAMLMAVTVTLVSEETSDGAVYSPTEETMPIDLFPPATPFTSHVRVSLVVPVIVGWNCWLASGDITVLDGESKIDTVETPGEVFEIEFAGKNAEQPLKSQTQMANKNSDRA